MGLYRNDCFVEKRRVSLPFCFFLLLHKSSPQSVLRLSFSFFVFIANPAQQKPARRRHSQHARVGARGHDRACLVCQCQCRRCCESERRGYSIAEEEEAEEGDTDEGEAMMMTMMGFERGVPFPILGLVGSGLYTPFSPRIGALTPFFLVVFFSLM